MTAAASAPTNARRIMLASALVRIVELDERIEDATTELGRSALDALAGADALEQRAGVAQVGRAARADVDVLDEQSLLARRQRRVEVREDVIDCLRAGR